VTAKERICRCSGPAQHSPRCRKVDLNLGDQVLNCQILCEGSSGNIIELLEPRGG
jgi:hypothetical protein